MAEGEDAIRFLQGEWTNAEDDRETYDVTGRSVSRHNAQGTRRFADCLVWQEKWKKLCWGPRGRYYIDPPDDSHDQVTWQVWGGGRGFRWRRPHTGSAWGKASSLEGGDGGNGSAQRRKVVTQKPRSPDDWPDAPWTKPEKSGSQELGAKATGPQAKKRPWSPGAEEDVVVEDEGSAIAPGKLDKEGATRKSEAAELAGTRASGTTTVGVATAVPEPVFGRGADFLGGEPGWAVERLVARKLLSAGFRPKPDYEDQKGDDSVP